MGCNAGILSNINQSVGEPLDVAQNGNLATVHTDKGRVFSHSQNYIDRDVPPAVTLEL